ncbi:MAG: hypothetical protein A3K19_07895 [Lentisphaerae bacterium RIFOXYB12_FULL_65_16]|nr:MAG: hypothetical protein A3K18_31770 [Lentisphaerae bacterium RIFOXYA12_64_32]OGV87573.1 MAG: hypothetical protein A3K19_07895 [Lentisphaerae bacterium RIFOXYB12_FULL_65_16]
MSAAGELLAAVDVGTNTVLLLTAEPDGHGGIRELNEASRTTRLGEGLDRTGELLPAAVDRTVTAVREFMALARQSATHGRGVTASTSAARDARNRDLFLSRWQAECGAPPLVFSGDEEARTSFTGIASDQPADRFLIGVDIGGGSTELCAGFGGRLLGSVSLNLGCVRFGERYLLYEIPEADAQAQASEAAAALLRPAARDILALGPRGAQPHVVVCGGTATTFAAMTLGLKPWDRKAVHGFAADAPATAAGMARLFNMPSAERAKLPGVSKGRAAVLPAGLLILGEVLRTLGVEGFTVTTRGLRYGLLLRLQQGDLQPTWTW